MWWTFFLGDDHFPVQTQWFCGIIETKNPILPGKHQPSDDRDCQCDAPSLPRAKETLKKKVRQGSMVFFLTAINARTNYPFPLNIYIYILFFIGLKNKSNMFHNSIMIGFLSPMNNFQGLCWFQGEYACSLLFCEVFDCTCGFCLIFRKRLCPCHWEAQWYQVDRKKVVCTQFLAGTPWKINMEHTNHPFRKENDLPNPYDYVPC